MADKSTDTPAAASTSDSEQSCVFVRSCDVLPLYNNEPCTQLDELVDNLSETPNQNSPLGKLS